MTDGCMFKDMYDTEVFVCPDDDKLILPESSGGKDVSELVKKSDDPFSSEWAKTALISILQWLNRQSFMKKTPNKPAKKASKIEKVKPDKVTKPKKAPRKRKPATSKKELLKVVENNNVQCMTVEGISEDDDDIDRLSIPTPIME